MKINKNGERIFCQKLKIENILNLPQIHRIPDYIISDSFWLLHRWQCPIYNGTLKAVPDQVEIILIFKILKTDYFKFIILYKSGLRISTAIKHIRVNRTKQMKISRVPLWIRNSIWNTKGLWNNKYIFIFKKFNPNLMVLSILFLSSLQYCTTEFYLQQKSKIHGSVWVGKTFI